MLVIRKKGLVVGTLIVILVIASYLNFAYNRNFSEDISSNISSEEVSDTARALESEITVRDFPEEVSASFFRDYRFERESTRRKEIEQIKEIIDNPNSDKELKKEAQARLLEITGNMEKEMSIEALIKSKGFKDAVVILGRRSVNVIVDKQELAPEEVAMILDIVKRETGQKTENIKIIPKM